MNGADRHWRDIWQAKGSSSEPIGGSDEQVLRALMRLGGYDSATATLSLEEFGKQARYIVELLDLGPRDSLFEVGCGAGATLFALRPQVARIAGLDYAQSLVSIARAALEGADISCAEACDLDVEPRFDAVLSVGAFLYFPDPGYARRVLERMMAKAHRVVAVIDVNDASRRAVAMELRLAANGGKPGPAQLFLERDLFCDVAAEHGWQVRFDECRVAGSINSRYRYNAVLNKNNGS
jgi:SAM-dependent methyltransferase